MLQSLFLGLFLLLSGLFSFQRTPVLSIQESPTSTPSSELVQKYKQLEAVRNALSDEYTRYNVIPTIKDATNLNKKTYQYDTFVFRKASKLLIGKAIYVEPTQGYTFSLLNNPKCQSSDSKEIAFYLKDNEVQLCPLEGQNLPEPLIYR
jgi:hypothetical protein